tara:strand:+ start:467 stop:610 length:144 start_codon:yes stop_codon:yes gene_type:complete
LVVGAIAAATAIETETVARRTIGEVICAAVVTLNLGTLIVTAVAQKK